MTSCAELLDNVDPEGHLVQLFGKDDRLLTRNIVRFLSEGLRRGDGLLMIASPEHSGSGGPGPPPGPAGRSRRIPSPCSKAVWSFWTPRPRWIGSCSTGSPIECCSTPSSVKR